MVITVRNTAINLYNKPEGAEWSGRRRCPQTVADEPERSFDGGGRHAAPGEGEAIQQLPPRDALMMRYFQRYSDQEIMRPFRFGGFRQGADFRGQKTPAANFTGRGMTGKHRSSQESILERAIAQTALEETRRLKDQMAFDHALSQQAEELHQRHHRRVEALIEKRLGRKRRNNWLYLPAAACLALVFWGALQLLRPPQDQVISPTPQVIALTAAPAPTQAPTATALITPSPDPTPVTSPTPTVTPTVTPTPAQAPAPHPTRCGRLGRAASSRRNCRRATA